MATKTIQSAADAAKPRANVAEVASVRRDDLFTSQFWQPSFRFDGSVGGVFINPDPVVQFESGGLGLAVYDDMLDKDNHCAGIIETRFNAVCSLPQKVEPANDSLSAQEQAKFARSVIDEIDDWDGTKRSMMDHVLKGYAVGEVMYEVRDDGKVGVSEIKDRDQRRFVFGEDWKPRLLSGSAPFLGEQLPDMKFLVLRHNARGGNPYGVGVGRSLYWASFFKKNGLKFWLVYSEKFGMPTVVGKNPKSLAPALKREFERVLDSLQKETSIRIDEDFEINLLEAMRSGGITTYESLMTFLNAEESKRVLGQTLTTEQGDRGSQSLGTVHQSVLQDRLETDARALSRMGTELLRWVTIFNFGYQPEGEYPKFVVDPAPPQDLKSLADRDKILVDMGVVMGEKATARRYGLQTELDENDQPLSPKPAPAPPTIGPDGKPLPAEGNAAPPKNRAGGPGARPAGGNFAEGPPPPPATQDLESDAMRAAGAGLVASEFLVLRDAILAEVTSGKA